MKNQKGRKLAGYWITGIMLGLIFTLVMFPIKGFSQTYMEIYIKNLPKKSLSLKEIEDLYHMREEEKLARDVYLTLYKKYNLIVFKNIAKAEKCHMHMIKVILEKYALEDPLKGIENKIGVFKDKKFTKLYSELVARGERSIVEALKVGAFIEDLDIKDLEDALSRTDNKDIKVVYQNLMKGSRNHMRAFIRVLKRYGGNYIPKFISKEEFVKIINTSHEAGIYGPEGKPLN